ncbi:ring canal kelch homolog [Aphis gossypii]|uniref:ring canal kelch homolog n=1 Tax=Aphis gossypii TaxID=80765 RepID=UPI002158F8E8|nr:ring canal kelch homolog [Aphis gossypii]XP_050055809.1 ring canal kelch homolog [Aphis gossypii]
MSVEEEIDPVLNPILKYSKCEPESYKNNLHKDRVFEVLQSSRNENDSFCDIKFQTDDGTIIYGHRNILASATPYFRAMFSSFGESNKDLVNIKKLDSTIFLLLIDYIYTGEIMITPENVQVVLAAADLLQLAYVKQACVEFLQKHLDPSNCLGIKVFADLHNCIELLSKCEKFIENQFLEIVKYDEFLSLSSEEVIKLISSSNIAVPFEEKIYECVLKWVKHQLNKRKHLLPNLMEHVRLPLISKEYLLENVVNEHLLKNDPKCKDYVFEALHFNLIKLVNPSSIPETIWCKPRQSLKIVLVLSWSSLKEKFITSWYDPLTNQLQIASEITNFGYSSTLCMCVVKDQFVFIVEGLSRCVYMLDTSLQPYCWVHKTYLLSSVPFLKVVVLNDSIYAICYTHNRSENTVEVFSCNTLKWQRVTSMPNNKHKFGVGVLNNYIYAVGGVNSNGMTNKSVDCYDPIKDCWFSIAQMSISRHSVGVGVLNGLMYAVGGFADNGSVLKSVEVYSPSDGVWTSIADMHLCRQNHGVVALNGLLYVIGGCQSNSDNSVEIYNPETNSWSMKTALTNKIHPFYGTVVVNKPPYL